MSSDYQRIIRFAEVKPGERFACSTTGVIYHKVDDNFGQEERGDKFEIFDATKLVYTDLPIWCCWSWCNSLLWPTLPTYY